MPIHTMNAAELREARRQKILRNGENRLKKITNLTGSDDVVNDVSTFNERSPLDSDCLPKDWARTTESPVDEPVLGEESEPKIRHWSLPSEAKETPVQKPFLWRLLSHKYIHIMLIALAAYTILRQQLGHLIYEDAMVPFYTFSVAQFTLTKKEQNAGMAGMIIALLGMYGFSSKLLATVADIIALGVTFAHDLCVYMFFFVLCTSLFGV